MPDPGGLVAILDKDDNCVACVGDGKGVKKGKFAAPHAMCIDSKCNLYVLE